MSFHPILKKLLDDYEFSIMRVAEAVCCLALTEVTIIDAQTEAQALDSSLSGLQKVDLEHLARHKAELVDLQARIGMRLSNLSDRLSNEMMAGFVEPEDGD